MIPRATILHFTTSDTVDLLLSQCSRQRPNVPGSGEVADGRQMAEVINNKNVHDLGSSYSKQHLVTQTMYRTLQ